MALVCRACRREMLDDDYPDDPTGKVVCPKCGRSGEWLSLPDVRRDPLRPYTLSFKDRCFLKAMRIQPE